jgi:hypothetical protein
MNKKDEARLRQMTAAMNEVLAQVMGNVKTKGTRTYYYAGTVGNKSFCYTLRKTGYDGKWGFWSWIQTKYKNGKVIRRRFAKSASGKKAQNRAYKLLEQHKKLKGVEDDWNS